MDGAESPLADPVVSPEAYTEEYYRTACAGHEEWNSSDGAHAAGIYEGSLRLAHLQAGETVVDIGTGRGELLAAAVDLGADRAIGIEYSSAAVELAERTIEQRGIGARASVQLADARRVPLDADTADLVTLLDVVEHLSPPELTACLSEAKRLLRPGGRLFVHTMPNRHIYDRTYRTLRLLWPGGRRWPAEPRCELELEMHVNEQTVESLRSALVAAGFRSIDVHLGDMVRTDFVPSPRAAGLIRRLGRVGFLRPFIAANIFAAAVS